MPVHTRLIAARLVEPAKFAEMLRTLSLDSPGHWRGDIMQVYLNPNEQAERVIALLESKVALGDRIRFRLLVNAEARGGSTLIVDAVVPRRAQEQPTTTKDDVVKESGGPSVETLAIVVTALLSIGSYVLQIKLARDS